MAHASYLYFSGLTAPVALHGCDELLPTINAAMARWPFKLNHDCAAANPCLTISQSKNRLYRVQRHKAGAAAAKTLDPVNAVCEMIAELAWEQLRSNPALLCIHGAAVVFAGRLVVFPAQRRAGKSTLAACLVARGMTIFSDDFLPLEIDGQGRILGLANGVLPRIRVPVSVGSGAGFGAWVDGNAGPGNAQYKYLKIDALAQKGAKLPVGAIVLLDRAQDRPASLAMIERAEAMDSMIAQNFARSVHSGTIVKSIDALTRSADLYRISYGNAQDAADVLQAAFTKWDRPVIGVPELVDAFSQAADLEKRGETAPPFRSERLYVQAAGLTEVSAGASWYLADGAGLAVHRLNQGSAAIWRLLEEPMTLDDIVGVLTDAFPDADPPQVVSDTRAVLGRFAIARLIQPAGRE